MRILAIASLYPLSAADFAGQFNHISFRALQRRGHGIDVIRFQCHLPSILNPRDWRRRGRPRVPLAYTLDGVPVQCPRFWRPPGKWWSPYECSWRYSAVIRTVARQHRKRPYDVVYGCELSPDGVVAMRIGRLLGVPAIVSSIGSDVNSYPYHSRADMTRTQWVLRGADLILVEGQGSIPAVRKLVSELPPIRVFNRGIDLDPFRQLSDRDAARRRFRLPLGRRLVVFVGLLIADKGVQVLLEAFRPLLDQFGDADLVIIGSGPLSDWLREQGGSPPWAGRLHLTGRLPFNVIPDVVSACNVFTLPSFAEGVPKSVIEAMAAGLPVVTTTVGGIPNVVRDGEHGILVPPQNVEALGAALRTILENPDGARLLGQAGRRAAFERFDADRNVQLLLDAAEEAIACHAERRLRKRAARPSGNG